MNWSFFPGFALFKRLWLFPAFCRFDRVQHVVVAIPGVALKVSVYVASVGVPGRYVSRWYVAGLSVPGLYVARSAAVIVGCDWRWSRVAIAGNRFFSIAATATAATTSSTAANVCFFAGIFAQIFAGGFVAQRSDFRSSGAWCGEVVLRLIPTRDIVN